MNIPVLLGHTAPNSPFGYVPTLMGAGLAGGLGDVNTNDPSTRLSVKEYVKANGTRVWASYQSPASNEAIRSMQRRLNWYAGLVKKPAIMIDGQIGPETLTFARAVATFALTHGAQLQGALLNALTASQQQLAEKAHVAADLLKQIVDVLGIDTSGTVVTPAPPKPQPTIPSYPTTPNPTSPPIVPDDFTYNASPAIGGKKHWAFYLAGGIVFVGLVGAAILIWKD